MANIDTSSTNTHLLTISPTAEPSTLRANGTVHAETGEKRSRNRSERPKVLQACDRCRTKKLKCVPIATDHTDLCQPCHTSNTSCTFDLPLTASRAKRIRNGMSVLRPQRGDEPDNEEDETDRAPSDSGSRDSSSAPGRAYTSLRLAPIKSTSARREGPTALSYILHSTPTLPLSQVEAFDSAHGFNLHSQSGDGFMLVVQDIANPPELQEPPPAVLEALRSDSWNEVVSRLVESFLVHVSPIMPIVVRNEMSEAGELLLRVMAAVAAARSNCPKEIFDTLRYIVRREMHDQDTLSDATRQNVQILLLACLVEELGVQAGTAPALSIQRTRLSSAMQMAQDLSMDQDDSLDPILRESNNRIWQCACVIDQWVAARSGMRPLSSLVPSFKGDSTHFLAHMSRLAALLGRVNQAIYSNSGITSTSNATLLTLRDDIVAFPSTLSDQYRFNGIWSSLPSGILHLLHTVVLILFYRPFMRFSFICPSDLDIDVNVPVWLHLLTSSRAALDWVINQDELADLLFFGPYAVGLCAWVQYHTWARLREREGMVILDKLKQEALDRWLSKIPSNHLPMRRQQLEMVAVLHKATQITGPLSSFSSVRGLNPTKGILNRLPELSIQGVTFLRDPSHPDGGVLVATRKAAAEIKDLPEGTIVIGGRPAQESQPSTLASDMLSSDPSLTADLNATALSAMFAIGSNGRIAEISTPNWEAAVAAFSYSGLEGLDTTTGISI